MAKTWRKSRRKIPPPPLPDLQELVREYPKVTQFYGALGQAYLANNQFKESHAVLERAMDLVPAQCAHHDPIGGDADAFRRQQARACRVAGSVQ